MSKANFITAVSLVALLGAAPAFAANTTTYDKDGAAVTSSKDSSLKEDVKEDWQKTKAAVSRTADKAGDKMEAASDKVKAMMVSDDSKAAKTPITLEQDAGLPTANSGPDYVLNRK